MVEFWVFSLTVQISEVLPYFGTVSCVLESQNHRTAWVGRDLTDHVVPTPAMDKDTFPYFP